MQICTLLTTIIEVAKPIVDGIKTMKTREELRNQLAKYKSEAQKLKDEYTKITDAAENTARKLDKWNDIFLKLEDLEGSIFRLEIFLRDKMKDREKSFSARFALITITGELKNKAAELAKIRITILDDPEVSSILNRISEIVDTIHKYGMKESWDCIKLELDGNGSDIEPKYGLKEGLAILRTIGMQSMEPSPELKAAFISPVNRESLITLNNWKKEWAAKEAKGV